MLSLSLRGMRTRWVTFVGSFLALALGVGIVATTGMALAATFDAPVTAPSGSPPRPSWSGARISCGSGPRSVSGPRS